MSSTGVTTNSYNTNTTGNDNLYFQSAAIMNKPPITLTRTTTNPIPTAIIRPLTLGSQPFFQGIHSNLPPFYYPNQLLNMPINSTSNNLAMLAAARQHQQFLLSNANSQQLFSPNISFTNNMLAPKVTIAFTNNYTQGINNQTQVSSITSTPANNLYFMGAQNIPRIPFSLAALTSHPMNLLNLNHLSLNSIQNLTTSINTNINNKVLNYGLITCSITQNTTSTLNYNLSNMGFISYHNTNILPSLNNKMSIISSHSPSMILNPNGNNFSFSHNFSANLNQQQFQRLKVEDALSYLDQVKMRFGNQPQVYNDFLDIMKEFKSQSIDTPGVIGRVSGLFKGHPDLIVGFNTFLPPGFKVEINNYGAAVPLGANSLAFTSATHKRSSDKCPPASSSASTPNALSLSISNFNPLANVSSGPTYVKANVIPTASIQQSFFSPMLVSTSSHVAGTTIPSSTTGDKGIGGRSSNMAFTGKDLLEHKPSFFTPIAVTKHNNPTPLNVPATVQPKIEMPDNFPVSGNVTHSRAESAKHPSKKDTPKKSSKDSPDIKPIVSSSAGDNSNLPQPVEFNHAINYVNKIKNRFQNKPEVYKSFLEVLHRYQREQRSLRESKDPSYKGLGALENPQIKKLKQLTGIDMSSNSGNSTDTESDDNSSIKTIKEPKQTTHRVRKFLTEAEVYSRVAKLFENQTDLLEEFAQFLPDACRHLEETDVKSSALTNIGLSAKDLNYGQLATDDSDIKNKKVDPFISLIESEKSKMKEILEVDVKPDIKPPLHQLQRELSKTADIKKKKSTNQDKDVVGVVDKDMEFDSASQHSPEVDDKAVRKVKEEEEIVEKNTDIEEVRKDISASSIPDKDLNSALASAKKFKLVLQDVTLSQAVKYGTLADYAFFDKIMNALNNQTVYNNFMRCLNLYIMDIITDCDLISLSQKFFVRFPELLQELKTFLGFTDSGSAVTSIIGGYKSSDAITSVSVIVETEIKEAIKKEFLAENVVPRETTKNEDKTHKGDIGLGQHVNINKNLVPSEAKSSTPLPKEKRTTGGGPNHTITGSVIASYHHKERASVLTHNLSRSSTTDNYKNVMAANNSSGCGTNKDMAKRIPGEFTLQLDYSSLKKCGVSYRALPKSYQQPLCGGRTGPCREVLNDTYVSFASWSEDSSFVSSRKSSFEENIYRAEDERFELDVVLESTRHTLKTLEQTLAALLNSSAKDKPAKLDDSLGGQSQVLHRKTLYRIYGEKAGEIIEGIKANPLVAIPYIVRRLRAKLDEWREAQRKFNKIWRDQIEKNYLKSLDHQGVTFKQTDVKSLRSKALLNEIETVYEEHKEACEQRATFRTNMMLSAPKNNESLRNFYYNLFLNEAYVSDLSAASLPRLISRTDYSNVTVRHTHSSSNCSLLYPAHYFGAFDLDSAHLVLDYGSAFTEAINDVIPLDNELALFPSSSEIPLQEVMRDSAELLIYHAKRQAAIGKDDKQKIKTLVRKFFPVFFAGPQCDMSSEEEEAEQNGEDSWDGIDGAKKISKDEEEKDAQEIPLNGRAKRLRRSSWDGDFRSTKKRFKPTPTANRDSGNSEEPRDKLFYGNDHFYLFFRLHQILCHRVAQFYAFSKRYALQYERQNNSSQTSVTTATNNDCVAKALMLKNPNAVKPTQYYKTFLELVRSYLDGNIDSNTYEDSLRDMFTIHAYSGFTIDKVIQNAVRQLNNIVSDNDSAILTKIFLKIERENASRKSRTASVDNKSGSRTTLERNFSVSEFKYRKIIEDSMPDQTLYQFRYHKSSSLISIKMVDPIPSPNPSHSPPTSSSNQNNSYTSQQNNPNNVSSSNPIDHPASSHFSNAASVTGSFLPSKNCLNFNPLAANNPSRLVSESDYMRHMGSWFEYVKDYCRGLKEEHSSNNIAANFGGENFADSANSTNLSRCLALKPVFLYRNALKGTLFKQFHLARSDRATDSAGNYVLMAEQYYGDWYLSRDNLQFHVTCFPPPHPLDHFKSNGISKSRKDPNSNYAHKKSSSWHTNKWLARKYVNGTGDLMYRKNALRESKLIHKQITLSKYEKFKRFNQMWLSMTTLNHQILPASVEHWILSCDSNSEQIKRGIILTKARKRCCNINLTEPPYRVYNRYTLSAE